MRQIKTSLLAVNLDRSIAIHDLLDPNHPRIAQVETNNAFEFIIPVSPQHFDVNLETYQQEACAGYSYGCFYECGMVYVKNQPQNQEEETKMQVDNIALSNAN